MPHTAKIADQLCFVKSMHTEAINHDLAAFVVMVSQGSGNPNDQPLYDRLWGSGFLPTRYQGVKLRAGGDPVLYLSNPEGMDDAARRRFVEDLGKVNQISLEE